MNSLQRWLVLIFLLLPLATAGCSNSPTPRSGKSKVMATYSVVSDFVRNVAGDQVELTTLVGGDGDAHTFEPSPQDGVALAQADVIFENGVGFEGWLDKLYSSSQSKAKRVVASKGLKLLEADDDHDHQDATQGRKHDHKEHDPHVWHDVQNAIQMVQVIRDELVKADPANADKYTANAAAYVQQLKDLDQWVVKQVATLPEANRKLVTSHDTFGYFSNRYGFKVVGTALASFSTEASDPSAKDFAKLVDAIKAANVPAIFAENVQNPKLMQRLAQEAGVKLAPPLYTDALGKPGSEGDTYIKMMRYNVTTIVTQSEAMTDPLFPYGRRHHADPVAAADALLTEDRVGWLSGQPSSGGQADQPAGAVGHTGRPGRPERCRQEYLAQGRGRTAARPRRRHPHLWQPGRCLPSSGGLPAAARRDRLAISHLGGTSGPDRPLRSPRLVPLAGAGRITG